MSFYFTKRPQNRCRNCGYTWYPRGKNVSLKCGNCGSAAVEIVPAFTAAGCAFVIVLVLVIVGAVLWYLPTSNDKDPSPDQPVAKQTSQPDAPPSNVPRSPSNDPKPVDEVGPAEDSMKRPNPPKENDPPPARSLSTEFHAKLAGAVQTRVAEWRTKAPDKYKQALDTWEDRVVQNWFDFVDAFTSKAAKISEDSWLDEQLFELAQQTVDSLGVPILSRLLDAIALAIDPDMPRNFGMQLYLEWKRQQ